MLLCNIHRCYRRNICYILIFCCVVKSGSRTQSGESGMRIRFYIYCMYVRNVFLFVIIFFLFFQHIMWFVQNREPLIIVAMSPNVFFLQSKKCTFHQCLRSIAALARTCSIERIRISLSLEWVRFPLQTTQQNIKILRILHCVDGIYGYFIVWKNACLFRKDCEIKTSCEILNLQKCKQKQKLSEIRMHYKWLIGLKFTVYCFVRKTDCSDKQIFSSLLSNSIELRLQ